MCGRNRGVTVAVKDRPGRRLRGRGAAEAPDRRHEQTLPPSRSTAVLDKLVCPAYLPGGVDKLQRSSN